MNELIFTAFYFIGFCLLGFLVFLKFLCYFLFKESRVIPTDKE